MRPNPRPVAFAEITIKYKNKVGPLLYILTIGSLVYTSTRPKTDRPPSIPLQPYTVYRAGRRGLRPLPEDAPRPPPSTSSTFSTRLNLSHAEIRRATQRGPPFYILYTVKPVRAAGDCRPYRWTTHAPINPVHPVNPV